MEDIPRSIRAMAVVHLVCLLVCSISVLCHGEESVPAKTCLHLPDDIATSCLCTEMDNHRAKFECKGLNTMTIFDLDHESQDGSSAKVENDILGSTGLADTYKFLLHHNVEEIVIRDSDLALLQLTPLSAYQRLRTLSVTGSGVTELELNNSRTLKHVLNLNLSSNNVSVSSLESLDKLFPNLRSLNLTRNSLSQLTPIFESMNSLRSLSLSDCDLNEFINPKVFSSLPKTLESLEIMGNSWTCSPKLAWIYDWSLPLLDKNIIREAKRIRCRYDNSEKTGPLFLLMEYYKKFVLPACPFRDNCSCYMTHIQDGFVTSNKRVYSVEVNCAGQGLKHFPKLPAHTRTVDLSNNELDSDAFSILHINEHNYNEVDNITLDDNKLDELPGKLLDMKLKLSFSARNNQLTSIPYDFSQRLLESTSVIQLSNNPWRCTCSSRITDLNLIAKIKDRKDLECGSSSNVELANKKISNLSPVLLCPPEASGEFQELILQILCVVLSILIVVVMTKFIYDVYVYKTRGQLPWLALKMPSC